MTTLYVDNIAPNLQSKISAPNLTLPAGTSIQVTAMEGSDSTTVSSTSFTEASNFRPAITPSATSSKILASFEINFWGDVDNDSQGTVSGGLKIEMYVGGSLHSTIYTSYDNNVARGGQNRFTTINVSKLVSPATTSEVTFRVYGKRNSGSRVLKFNEGSKTRAVLTEIAG